VGGVEVQLYSFLTLVLHGGEGLKSHPGHFMPEEKPWYPLLGGWVGPVASMDDLEKRKISHSC